MRRYIINPGLPVIKEGWKGNLSDGRRFLDGENDRPASFRDLLKWKSGRNPQAEQKKKDDFRPEMVRSGGIFSGGDKIVWFGHASFLIRIGGKNILTDPCFHDLALIRRRVDIPCPEAEIAPVDYVLISHDHRDHLDKRSVKEVLRNNPEAEFLVPLNAGRLLPRGARRQEAGWFQRYDTGTGIGVVFLPARHWGRRGIRDFNRTLWGSFLIEAEGKRIFFAGDTGYGSFFDEIRRTVGNIDTCMMPIGAYSPRFIMERAHMDPEEAVRAFGELGGKTFIPMHYGTYDLSDEPPEEPLSRLVALSDRIGGKMIVPAVGEIIPVP